MSRKLLSWSSRKTLLKLSSIVRKSKPRFRTKRLFSSKMLVSTECATLAKQRLERCPTINSSYQLIKSADAQNKAISSVGFHNRRVNSSNDDRAKIESVLLQQHEELFASNLSRNALQKVVKQKALEIASKLGLKFKGTKKWLISFIKRCELLGYVDVTSDIRSRKSLEGAKHANSLSTSQNTVLSNGLLDITTLFSSDYIDDSSSHSNSLYTDDVVTDSQPTVRITGQSFNKPKRYSENVSFASHNAKNIKLSNCDAVLLTKNFGLLPNSRFFSRAYYAARYTGCILKRNVDTLRNVRAAKFCDKVYDDLFEIMQTTAASSEKSSTKFCNRVVPTSSPVAIQNITNQSSSSKTVISSNCKANLLANLHERANEPIKKPSVTIAYEDPLLTLFDSSSNEQQLPVDEMFSPSSRNLRDSTASSCPDSIDPLLNLFESEPAALDITDSEISRSPASTDPLLDLFQTEHLSDLSYCNAENTVGIDSAEVRSESPFAIDAAVTSAQSSVSEKSPDVTTSSELSNPLPANSNADHSMLDIDELFNQPLDSSASDVSSADTDWIDSLIS